MGAIWIDGKAGSLGYEEMKVLAESGSIVTPRFRDGIDIPEVGDYFTFLCRNNAVNRMGPNTYAEVIDVNEQSATFRLREKERVQLQKDILEFETRYLTPA